MLGFQEIMSGIVRDCYGQQGRVRLGEKLVHQAQAHVPEADSSLIPTMNHEVIIPPSL